MFNVVTLKRTALLAGLVVLAFGCKSSEDKKAASRDTRGNIAEADETAQPAEAQVTKAFSVVSAREGSSVVGAVTFTQAEGGVRIVADIGGLTPGKHGFHIHEHGDCSAQDASSAGGHFNPTKQKHGGPDTDTRHVGDLGNVDANEAGFAHYDRIDKVITLNGENSIVGKSVVVHEKEDDLKTDPAGNAGKRIGCGSIVGSKQ